MKIIAILTTLTVLLITVNFAGAQVLVQVTDNSYINYMPSLIQAQNSDFIIAYEQLDSNYGNGDLMITTSTDGQSWSNPSAIIDETSNERHPCLLQMPDGSFLVFYLSDAGGSYDIYVATSPDAVSWTQLGSLELGWPSSFQPINPTACLAFDGSVTLSYDVLSNGGYISHSADGLTWDQNRTQVSNGALNRIMRHSDGTYLLSYQRRTGSQYYEIDIFTKTSTDLVNWSAENQVTTNMNSHDSFPLELGDGSYGLYMIKSFNGQPYDIYSYTSIDAVNWDNEENLMPYYGFDTQPHPILSADNRIAMAWARGATQSVSDVFFTLFENQASVDQNQTANDPPVLSDNYPNPFNSQTTISFSLNSSGMEHSEISVYNINGQRVRTLLKGISSPGQYQLVWDGKDDNDEAVSSGIYFYKLISGKAAAIKKMILVK